MPTTYYTKDHEWLLIEDDIAILGITDHAQEALGEIVFVESPDIGAMCIKGEAIAVVESVKAASDIFAPINGEVIEVNTHLEDSPELVNESPEAEGWFIKIRIKEAFEIDSYMSKEEYLASISD